jgi:hypothetical protein
MAATRRLLACLVAASVLGASQAFAQSLDGTWRGTTSGTPSGGNCRPFTFDVAIRGANATGSATTPHSGPSVHWTVSGAVSGSRACNPTCVGTLKMS